MATAKWESSKIKMKISILTMATTPRLVGSFLCISIVVVPLAFLRITQKLKKKAQYRVPGMMSIGVICYVM